MIGGWNIQYAVDAPGTGRVLKSIETEKVHVNETYWFSVPCYQQKGACSIYPVIFSLRRDAILSEVKCRRKVC